MNYFALAALILMSLAGAVLHYKKQQRFKGFVHLMFYALLGLIAIPYFEGSGFNMVFGVIGLLSVNFLFGTFLTDKFKRPFIRLLFPVLTATGYLVYFQGSTATVFGLEYTVVNKFLMAGAALMLLTLDVGTLKLSLFDKFIGGFSEKRLIKAFTVFMLAFGAFLGIFSASLLGLYILGAIYLSTLFYRKNDNYYLSTSFLGIFGAGVVLNAFSAGTGLDLMEGDTLMGLFFGAFALYFIQLISKARKKSLGAHFVAYFLPIALVLFLLVAGMQYEKMGGMDALAAMILGVAVVNSIVGRGYLGMSVMGWLIAFGLIAPKFMVNADELEFKEQMIVVEQVQSSSNENEASRDEVGASLSDLKGKFKFVVDSSRVSFVLGPKKETQGAFKKVSGSIDVGDDLKKTKVKVELKLVDLTTFNKFRDESLMSDEYFSADKFPVMTYESNELEELRTGEYLLKGKFKMLGVEKSIDVKMLLVEQNDKNYLTGSGTIDRREFGMAPSATEGNVVEFTYQVQLDQK